MRAGLGGLRLRGQGPVAGYLRPHPLGPIWAQDASPNPQYF